MRSSPSLRRTPYQPADRPLIKVADGDARKSYSRFVMAALLHVGLALLLYTFRPLLPTLYTIALVFAGLAVLRDEKPTRLIYVCGYIIGAELIWRMTKANVFWETGKYLIIFFMILGIFRWRVHLQGMGILFIIVLIPGIFLTIGVMNFTTMRDFVSFNMSGPFALGIAVAFLGGVRLNREEVGNFLLISLLPIVGVGTLAARSTLVTRGIAFITESNFTTSGGYGPNQISAILSLGSLLGIIYLFVAHPAGLRWWFMILLSGVFLLQSILTFSRGGLLNLVFAIPAAIFFFTQNGGKERWRIMLLVIVLSALLSWSVPILNRFTGRALQARYEELDTTGRLELIKADLRTWQRNPVFGVGVGMGSANRGLSLGAGHDVSAHTEYSRLLAEHGLLGLAAIILMGSMFISGLKRSRGQLARGIAAGFMIWAMVEMAHADMRIAAVSLFFAFPFAALNMEDEK